MSNINKHLSLDSILADCQDGFQSRRSCETPLGQFVHNIISKLDGAMNSGHKQTDLITLSAPGVGSNHFFSESSHVAYQIKGNRA